MVESRTDVVFANLTYGFHTGPIGRLSEMPSVLYLNEPFRWLYEAQPDWPWNAIPPSRCRVWTPSYLRWFIEDAIEVQTKRVKAREESRNARAYDRILVNSLFTRETVLRTYGCDARVCYLGVDADVFKPTPGPRDNLVVGVGVVRPRKRVHRAIEAVATVPAARRPALVWIGNAVDERYARRLHALAEDLSVAFKIRSRITDAELSATLARAKAMIYAPRLEPFGLAPLEANACETPVVAVAEGGVRETIRHGVNGLVVQDDTPRMLGDALDGLLSNPQRLAKMGRQGRELVLREWSWSTAIDRLEGQLMDVCGA